jgi:hypothetical protein
MVIALLLLAAMLFAPFTAFAAGQRGYDVMAWYVLGLFLGPAGLLAFWLPRRMHDPELLFAADHG